MKTIFLALTLSLTHSALADIATYISETTITGAEATKLALALKPTLTKDSSYSSGSAFVSCAKKPKEKDYTCVIHQLR